MYMYWWLLSIHLVSMYRLLILIIDASMVDIECRCINGQYQLSMFQSSILIGNVCIWMVDIDGRCINCWYWFSMYRSSIQDVDVYTVKNKRWYLWQAGEGHYKRKWTSPHLPVTITSFCSDLHYLATDTCITVLFLQCTDTCYCHIVIHAYIGDWYRRSIHPHSILTTDTSTINIDDWCIEDQILPIVALAMIDFCTPLQ